MLWGVNSKSCLQEAFAGASEAGVPSGISGLCDVLCQLGGDRGVMCVYRC